MARFLVPSLPPMSVAAPDRIPERYPASVPSTDDCAISFRNLSGVDLQAVWVDITGTPQTIGPPEPINLPPHRQQTISSRPRHRWLLQTQDGVAVGIADVGAYPNTVVVDDEFVASRRADIERG
jgi:hypothetical protein